MSKTELSKDEKIERLEQRVEDLEDQHDEEVSISRRTALGGGALGLGALLGGGGALSQAGTAKAQVASTGTLKGVNQIGTSDERVETLFVDEVDELLSSTTVDGNVDFAGYDAQNVGLVAAESSIIGNEGDGNLGPDTRRFAQVGETLVNVPGDYPTIQDALDDVPIYLRDDYIISVDDGDYSGEDLIIPPHVTADVVTNGTYGSTGILKLEGNQTAPSNVTVGSIAALGAAGRNSPQVAGLKAVGGTPADNDESIAMLFASGGNAQVIDCEIGGDGTGKGITAYSGTVTVQNVDFGTGNRELLMENKHGGSIWCASSGTVEGHSTGEVFSVATNPGISYDSNNTSLSSDGDFVRVVRSYLIDRNFGAIWTGDGLPSANKFQSLDPDGSATIYPEQSDNIRIGSGGSTVSSIDASHAVSGDELIITSRSDGTNVDILHMGGNIRLQGGADVTLTQPQDMLWVKYDGGTWNEISLAQF